MAKAAAEKTKKAPSDGDAGPMLRRPAEIEYAAELAALHAADREPRPDGWLLSPKAVRTYVLGGRAGNTEIRPKYLGSEPRRRDRHRHPGHRPRLVARRRTWDCKELD